MVGKVSQKFNTTLSLLFCFIFFFVIEWRWEALLFDLPDIKPHRIAAFVSVAVILLSFFYFRKQRIEIRIIFLLICYFIGVSVLNVGALNGAPDYNVTTELGMWSINLALFIAGANRATWKYVYQHSKIMVILYMFFVLPLFFILWHSGYAAESNFNLRNAIWLSGLAGNSDYGVSYQTFGDKLAILTFVIFFLNLRNRLRIAISIIAFISLYVAGSKASMVGYLFACVSYYIILLGLNRHYLKCASIIFVSICLLCSGLLYIVGNSSLQNSDNWLISTIARGRNDISISSRQLIEEDNEKTRSSRILLGDYKFDTKLGRPGTYTHSALGIVDYYGILIFIIALGIWFYLLFKLLVTTEKTPLMKTALMSMLYYTLLFAIARFPTVNYLFYWVLGMVACAIHLSNTCIKSKQNIGS